MFCSIRKRKTRTEADSTPRMAALLDAAERVFRAKGYHAATMSDVAQASGMSKKTVYELVESKTELFAAMLAQHHAQIQFPQPKPDWTVADILTANLICLARFMLAPPQIALIRLIMAEHTHGPDFGRVFLNTKMVKAKAQLEDCLAGVARAQGATQAQAKEMSAMLFGMALGEFQMGTLIGFRAPPGKQALESRVRRAVEIFLSGCGAGVTPPLPTCGAQQPAS
jgi:AcrR family transcriptional regulator